MSEQKPRTKSMSDIGIESMMEAFVRKIADGKLLLRFSYMTFNVTCDCCHSEEHLEAPRQPDRLHHKPWCIVTAARELFPGFIPNTYPESLSDLRGYLEPNCTGSQFVWLDHVARRV